MPTVQTAAYENLWDMPTVQIASPALKSVKYAHSRNIKLLLTKLHFPSGESDHSGQENQLSVHRVDPAVATQSLVYSRTGRSAKKDWDVMHSHFGRLFVFQLTDVGYNIGKQRQVAVPTTHFPFWTSFVEIVLYLHLMKWLWNPFETNPPTAEVKRGAGTA